MAIPSQDRQASNSDGESEATQVELPRKASFSQLLARYLRMGFLSCFGMSGAGPEQRRTIDEEDYRALQRQMSRPLEVPHDDSASSKDEPHAQIVESYGPENSVPASFKTSFLGTGFDNEFSLTNGVKWQVWQKPGELSPEALAHFQTSSSRVSQTPFGSPSEANPPEVHPLELNPSEVNSLEVNRLINSPTEPSPDLSVQGNSSLPEFELPPSMVWDGWGERLSQESEPVKSSHALSETTSRDALGADSAEVGESKARVSGIKGIERLEERAQLSNQQEDKPIRNMSDGAGATGKGDCENRLQSDGVEMALDTSDGAALLSKLGAPQTIPLTPEIEEELRRSSDSPVALSSDGFFNMPFSVHGSKAAGPLTNPLISPLTGLQTSPLTGPITKPSISPLTGLQTKPLTGPQTTSQTSPLTGPRTGPLTSPLTSPLTQPPAPLRTKSQSASLARVKTPLRTQSLRSEGSFKIVKETHRVKEGEDDDGHKTVNQYVKLRRIGTGSYGKVVLHKDSITGKLYAMKILHRSRLMHVHISGEETAWTDVLRETAIMKQLDHPNLVSLREVIDDPDNDKIYMVLEYEEKGPVFEGTGPEGGVGEANARAYMRDVLAGLQYLHYQNIVHGDIKPDNLLMSAEGRIKIGDFGVSHIFENENDQLRRTPGTPAFTAPECCLGKPYHGKPADMWALGCTLYVFVTGQYPFMTTSHALEGLYEAILHEAVAIPAHLHPDLQDFLLKLLEKDPTKRLTAEEAAQHPWLTADLGPLAQVKLGAIGVGADQLQAAMTQLDDASKGRLSRLFTRHAAAVRRRKATAAKDAPQLENGPLSRTSSLKSTDAYDSDFSAPSSRCGSPKRDFGATQSPFRAGSSRFSSSERSLNLE